MVTAQPASAPMTGGLPKFSCWARFLCASTAERTFTRGVSTYPGLGSPIYTTTGYELSLVYAPPRKATAKVGTLFQDPSIPAYVVASPCYKLK